MEWEGRSQTAWLERLGAVGWSGRCSQGLAEAPGLSGWVGVGVGGPHIHADVQQMRLKKMDYLTWTWIIPRHAAGLLTSPPIPQHGGRPLWESVLVGSRGSEHLCGCEMHVFVFAHLSVHVDLVQSAISKWICWIDTVGRAHVVMRSGAWHARTRGERSECQGVCAWEGERRGSTGTVLFPHSVSD